MSASGALVPSVSPPRTVDDPDGGRGGHRLAGQDPALVDLLVGQGVVDVHGDRALDQPAPCRWRSCPTRRRTAATCPAGGRSAGSWCRRGGRSVSVRPSSSMVTACGVGRASSGSARSAASAIGSAGVKRSMWMRSGSRPLGEQRALDDVHERRRPADVDVGVASAPRRRRRDASASTKPCRRRGGARPRAGRRAPRRGRRARPRRWSSRGRGWRRAAAPGAPVVASAALTQREDRGDAAPRREGDERRRPVGRGRRRRPGRSPRPRRPRQRVEHPVRDQRRRAPA